MKILHTSDWHLGHTLYNYDRTVEQQAFLRQLTRIVTEEQPDAMVVSNTAPCWTLKHRATNGRHASSRHCWTK